MRPSYNIRESLFAFVLICACEEGDNSEPFPFPGETLLYDGPDFEVWASEGLEACGGTFEYTEAWLRAFRARVGVHSDPTKATFHWLTEDDFAEFGRPGVLAFATPSKVIYSTVIPIEHEFVHTDLHAFPPSLLREGAAEVFGAAGGITNTGRYDVAALIEENQIGGEVYHVAGRFSRFIIDRHGMDKYFELYNGLDGARGTAEFAAGSEEFLGESLSSLLDAFADHDADFVCFVEQWRFFDLECRDLPLVPWRSASEWVHDIDLSCEASDVVGPRSGVAWVRRALVVEEAGFYTLSVESEDPTTVAFLHGCTSCGDDQGEQRRLAATIDASPRMYLTPGRHWLQVQHAGDSDASVRVSLEH